MRNYIPDKYADNKWIWNTTQAILSTYETMKHDFDTRREEILHSSPGPPDGQPKGANDTDSTISKVMQLDSKYLRGLDWRIKAIESALEKMTRVEREFTKQYFWEWRTLAQCNIKRKYKNGNIVESSEGYLSHVKGRVISKVAIELGYIEEEEK